MVPIKQKTSKITVDVEKFHRRIVIIATIMGGGVSLVFGWINFISGNVIAGVIELVTSLIALYVLVSISFFKVDSKKVGWLVILAAVTLVTTIFVTGGYENTGAYWVAVVPAVAFLIQGTSTGLFYTLLMAFIIMIVSGLQVAGIVETPYSFVVIRQILVSYFTVSGLIYGMQSINERFEQTVEEQKKILEKYAWDLSKEMDREQSNIKKLEIQKKDLELAQTGMLNLVEDLEHEQQLVEAQSDELKKFKQAVDSAYDYIVITDKSGVVLYVNKAATKITGYSPEEVIGKKAGAAWGKQMPESFYKNMWKTISVKKQVYTSEITNVRKNGEKFIADISISPILDENGNVDFYVSIQRDITNLKLVDKMKTEFISLASHQLRTPLSAMRWFSEMLINGDGGVLNPDQLDMVKNIYDSNLRMIALVNALLNVSRIESGRILIDPKPVDVVAIAKQVFDEVKIGIKEKDLELTFLKSPNVPTVVSDKVMISELITTFITNAVKYTQVGGKVDLKVFTEDGRVVVMVEDTGIGIPKVQQKNLFTKFFRADNVSSIDAEGTGLGLYLASLIAKSLLADLGFESEENKGSKFWFKLPKEAPPAKKGEVSLNQSEIATVLGVTTPSESSKESS